jgi:phosphopantetheinyl transferase (holo-ACP synthase)
MIGNDVIDLQLAQHQSNWQREGFLQKLFTTEEQLLITKDPEPERMVWLLWSMKEAAYKIYNRQTKKRAYIPKKLQCTLLSKGNFYSTGQVFCEDELYHTKTILSTDSIHTIAVSHLTDLNQVIEIENKGITKDENGIPYFITKPNTAAQDVSLSHHGRFEKVVKLNKATQ